MSFVNRISGKNREGKYRKFLDIVQPYRDTTVLDVGFNDREYSPYDNFLEKKYPYPERIVALGLKEPVQFAARYPAVKAVKYDGKVFPFPDGMFDVCWSNAVLEHVGSFDDQVFFLKEIMRTCRAAFITTPNRLFPVEVHTRTPLLHYLPKPIFDGYLKCVGKHWATGRYMNLLSIRDIHQVLCGAGIQEYSIIPNRLLGFPLDYIIVIGDIADRV